MEPPSKNLQQGQLPLDLQAVETIHGNFGPGGMACRDKPLIIFDSGQVGLNPAPEWYGGDGCQRPNA
jgi:hypothetical protein